MATFTSRTQDLEKALAPLRVARDLSTDSTIITGTRVRGMLDNFVFTMTPRPVDAVVTVLEDMAHKDPFVARYRAHEEIEIHPVFGGASLPELLAWP